MIEVKKFTHELYTCYYIKGTYILHREDGPAIERADGSKFWYKNNKLHREDGPAIEYVSGYKEYYYNGKRFDCKTTEEFIRLVKLELF